MMGKHYYKVLMVLSFVLSNYHVLLISRNPHRIRIFLESGEHLVLPKNANLQFINPLIRLPTASDTNNYENFGNEFDIFLPPITKTIDFPTVTSSGEIFSPLKMQKSCCDIKGNNWNSKEILSLGLFEPSIDLLKVTTIETTTRKQPNFDEVKPVTEHIEDDFKYDFRTKIHSYK